MCRGSCPDGRHCRVVHQGKAPPLPPSGMLSFRSTRFLERETKRGLRCAALNGRLDLDGSRTVGTERRVRAVALAKPTKDHGSHSFFVTKTPVNVAGEQKLLRRVVLYEFGAIGTPRRPPVTSSAELRLFGKEFKEAPPPPTGLLF